jgi:uncharacterized membrane protein YjdF
MVLVVETIVATVIYYSLTLIRRLTMNLKICLKMVTNKNFNKRRFYGDLQRNSGVC